MKQITHSNTIENQIFMIRGHRVMFDFDLAFLYGVSVGRLNEAIKRNKDRFPSDFMFQLSGKEFESLKRHFEKQNLKSKIAISSSAWGGRRHAPYAFTEQGVAMLSSVLKSKRAVQVNIAIMQAFVKLREILSTHKELARKLEILEKKYEKHDGEIQEIFQAIRELMEPPPGKPKSKIGFHP